MSDIIYTLKKMITDGFGGKLCERHKLDDEVNPRCGWEVYILTPEDIAALNNGGILTSDINDEYTIIICNGGGKT